MKIGICGAPCTGKTTLAKAVGERLGIPVIGESFDAAIKQLNKRKIKHTKSEVETFPEYFERVWKYMGYQSEIVNFTKAIAWDLDEKEINAGESFITDSASPSQAAAGLLYNVFLENEIGLHIWVTERLLHAVSYDYLIYLPITQDIPLVDDKRRPVNKNQRAAFDYLVSSLLEDNLGTVYSFYNVLPIDYVSRALQITGERELV